MRRLLEVLLRGVVLTLGLAVALTTAPTSIAHAAPRPHSAERRKHPRHHHHKRHHHKHHHRHTKRTPAPTPVPAPVPAPVPTPAPAPVATTPPAPTPSGPVSAVTGERLYVDPSSNAYRAWQSDPSFAPIALTPQAFWVTDPTYTLPQLRSYVAGAAAAGATPVVAVYGIPDRDCGGYSSGGLTDTTYLPWIDDIAATLAGHKAMVVLEPDALALTTNACGDTAARLALLRSATQRLGAAGARVYLDAGHSGWVPPDQMATLLLQAGVAGARGFATNVSSFGSTTQETAYADAIVADLALSGVIAHYVVDTSRNGGATPPPPGVYCNPSQARLGASPRLFYGGALDATLWIKRPGESDGACDGAPPAGQWYDAYARLLMNQP